MLVNAGRTNVWRLLGLSKALSTSLSRGLVPKSALQAHNARDGSSIARRLLSTATSNLESPAPKTAKATKKRATSAGSTAKAGRKKATSRKKKAPARSKSTKKTLSPEQKAKAKAKKERETVRELKRLALEKPKILPRSAWLAVNAEFAAKGKSGTTEAATKYKSLTREEREHYENVAKENRASNEAIYKKWLESHTPEQIYAANKARASLRRRSPGNRVYPKLKDERQIPRPLTSFMLFAKEQRASGDMGHLKATEVGALIGKQWRELPEDEKKVRHKYTDAAAENVSRYHETMKMAHKGDTGHAGVAS
ncbi:hypothetical protein GP486_001868 [Trichoglossum hirsutum]|uniref:HMG box domain-containing protein n=1 Tax=Trichoglossum hirsutum TaxID=265104 RepID=A0A9P8LG31_9PEZI|nr:hypothetical protein GP486_001868 [Trichoglossum hirsutum]